MEEKRSGAPAIARWVFFRAAQLTPVQVEHYAVSDLTIGLGIDHQGQIQRAVFMPVSQTEGGDTSSKTGTTSC